MDRKSKVKKPSPVNFATKKSNLNISTVLIAVIVLVKAYGCYRIYEAVTFVPELPTLDVNKWWGPNETIDNQDESIRPFRIVFSDALKLELSHYFDQYRRNAKHATLEGAAWTYGVNSEAFDGFLKHWLFKYSYRHRIRFLNQFDHYKTAIQGLDIHFMHVKPKVAGGVKIIPLLILHGWPGSVREFYEAVPLLTTERPGYDFVFELIIPSLPGFIYSDGATKPGLNTYEAAIIMANLMQRLGFYQYYIQGGDFGHVIGSHMATLFPNKVLGFHTTFPTNFAKTSVLAWALGSVWPMFFSDGLADRMYPLADKVQFYLEESGYAHLQGTKPDTIGIALQDSPAGLASYFLDRFLVFTDPNNKFSVEGGLDKYYSYDSILDNIMLYWASNSITTAMRLYKETVQSSDMEQMLARIPTSVPTWVLRSRHEIFQQPDFILRWKYNVVGSTSLEYGGHFLAFERPADFADDVFKAVHAFRQYYRKN